MYVKINASEKACYAQLLPPVGLQKVLPVADSVEKGKPLLRCETEIPTRGTGRVGAAVPILRGLRDAMGTFLLEHCIPRRRALPNCMHVH